MSAAEKVAGRVRRSLPPATLSYAGTVWLTVLSDPAQAPDVGTLTAALQHELSPPPG